VQSAADATGSAASPSTVNMVLAAAKATTSFLLLNTVADLLPPCDVRSPQRRDHTAASNGRY
jgi:hypothetical protein